MSVPRLVLTAALALFADSLRAQVTPLLPEYADDIRADAHTVDIPNPSARP